MFPITMGRDIRCSLVEVEHALVHKKFCRYPEDIGNGISVSGDDAEQRITDIQDTGLVSVGFDLEKDVPR